MWKSVVFSSALIIFGSASFSPPALAQDDDAPSLGSPETGDGEDCNDPSCVFWDGGTTESSATESSAEASEEETCPSPGSPEHPVDGEDAAAEGAETDSEECAEDTAETEESSETEDERSTGSQE